MLLEKIAVSKGKSIFFTRERKFFEVRTDGNFLCFHRLIQLIFTIQ